MGGEVAGGIEGGEVDAVMLEGRRQLHGAIGGDIARQQRLDEESGDGGVHQAVAREARSMEQVRLLRIVADQRVGVGGDAVEAAGGGGEAKGVGVVGGEVG